MFNPMYIYIMSYLIVLLFYSFGWSTLYPTLSYELLAFILLTSGISLLPGGFIRKIKIDFTQDNTYKEKFMIRIEFMLLIGYAADFMYAKNIPLLPKFKYQEFGGIQFLHPLLSTLSIFLCTYLFYSYIRDKKRRKIVFYFINFIPQILLISRSTILIIIISSMFVYIKMKINLKKLFNLKVVFSSIILILISGYLFGLVGNIRENREINPNDLLSNTMIINVGLPTYKFVNSKIPKEYFWAYIYISSPLANLQNQINFQNTEKGGYDFILGAIVPDIFANKIIGENNLSFLKTTPNRISNALTVSTCYSTPYMTLGYIGMIIYYLYTVIICILYALILKKRSDLYIVGMSILCTIILLNTFNNMFEYSGISFSLLWPLFFMIFSKVRIKLIWNDLKQK